MPEYAIERTLQGLGGRRAPRTLPLVLFAILAGWVAAPTALATPGHGNSAATITASFADACRDFAAHSSKDISHVELHYLDGRVVKDEHINNHDHAIDGGAGDEIAFAIVKSGTTSEQFDCVQSNRAPLALLEIKTPPCGEFFAGGLMCLQDQQLFPRTEWTGTSEVPNAGGNEAGFFHWGCTVDTALCSMSMSLRGTGSNDPDGDITSWSLDFGDGTSVSGSWSTAPPTEVAHEYSHDAFGDVNCHAVLNYVSNVCVITLTVTDSAGQSDSDVLLMIFLNQTPG